MTSNWPFPLPSRGLKYGRLIYDLERSLFIAVVRGKICWIPHSVCCHCHNMHKYACVQYIHPGRYEVVVIGWSTPVWRIIIEWWMLAQRMRPSTDATTHAHDVFWWEVDAMIPDDRLLDSGVVHHFEMNACQTDVSSSPCWSMPIDWLPNGFVTFITPKWSIVGLWCGASLRNECLPNGHVQLPMQKHVDHWWVHSGAAHHHDGTPAWWCRNWATNSGVAHHHQMMNASCPTELSLSWLRMIDFWTLVWCIMTKWMLAQRICPELIMKQNPCPTDVPITHIHLGYIWWHSHRMCSSPNAEHTLIMWSVALGVMSS